PMPLAVIAPPARRPPNAAHAGSNRLFRWGQAPIPAVSSAPNTRANRSPLERNATVNSTCRICETPLHHLFVDLGLSPLCQSVIRPDQINEMEPFYPLRVHVCDECFLV